MVVISDDTSSLGLRMFILQYFVSSETLPCANQSSFHIHRLFSPSDDNLKQATLFTTSTNLSNPNQIPNSDDLSIPNPGPYTPLT